MTQSPDTGPDSGFTSSRHADGSLEVVIPPRREPVYLLAFGFGAVFAAVLTVGWTTNYLPFLATPVATSWSHVRFSCGFIIGTVMFFVVSMAFAQELFLRATLRVTSTTVAVRQTAFLLRRTATAPIEQCRLELKAMWWPVEQPELLDKKFKEPPLETAPQFNGVRAHVGRRRFYLGRTLTELQTIRLLRLIEDAAPGLLRTRLDREP